MRRMNTGTNLYVGTQGDGYEGQYYDSESIYSVR